MNDVKETSSDVNATLPAVRSAPLPAEAKSELPARGQELPPYAKERVEGISTVPLKDAEIAALTAPVDEVNEVEIRPDGIIYMPEICIRLRLDKALKPGQWALKAESAPGWDKDANEAMYDGSLWVKGKYVARAVGGCRWQPSNMQMSKTDALEGARSDCLRRCCKDLGIGRELWSPEFVRRWKATYTEQYHDSRTGKMLWRKKQNAGATPSTVADVAPASADAKGGGAGEQSVENLDGQGDSSQPSPPARSAEPVCPKCKGPLWDNRAKRAEDEAAIAAGTRTKKPRAAWSCKDKKCGGAIWPSEPEAKSGAAEVPAPESSAKPDAGGAQPSAAASDAWTHWRDGLPAEKHELNVMPQSITKEQCNELVVLRKEPACHVKTLADWDTWLLPYEVNSANDLSEKDAANLIDRMNAAKAAKA